MNPQSILQWLQSKVSLSVDLGSFFNSLPAADGM